MYTPIDAAFSVLKPEEEVRKILPVAALAPYAIPALMAAYGVHRGRQNVKENKVTDPVVGVVSREGDDSFGSNLAEFGTGFAQGFVPGVGLKGLATRGGKKLATRRAAQHKIAEKKAAEAGALHATMSAQQQQAMLQAQNPGIVFGRTVQTLPPSQVGAARTAAQQAGANASRLASPGIGSRSLTALGQPMKGRLPRALVAGAGFAYGGKQIADALGNMSMGGSGTAAPSGSGMGGGQQQQQRTQSNLRDPSTGNQNLENVGVGQTGREQIWQQGGSGTFKGETMTFTHYDGNEMLRKTLKDLDKMHCGTEQKAEEDKGDKKSKKPAHGMVIVIGSKNAGPGPSTDGKRDSKD